MRVNTAPFSLWKSSQKSTRKARNKMEISFQLNRRQLRLQRPNVSGKASNTEEMKVEEEKKRLQRAWLQVSLSKHQQNYPSRRQRTQLLFQTGEVDQLAQGACADPGFCLFLSPKETATKYKESERKLICRKQPSFCAANTIFSLPENNRVKSTQNKKIFLHWLW